MSDADGIDWPPDPNPRYRGAEGSIVSDPWQMVAKEYRDSHQDDCECYRCRYYEATSAATPPAPTEDGWDAAMTDPAFVASLDEGLADVAAGRLVPHNPAPTEDATLDVERLLAAMYREHWRTSKEQPSSGDRDHWRERAAYLAREYGPAARVSAPITESDR